MKRHNKKNDKELLKKAIAKLLTLSDEEFREELSLAMMTDKKRMSRLYKRDKKEIDEITEGITPKKIIQRAEALESATKALKEKFLLKQRSIQQQHH